MNNTFINNIGVLFTGTAISQLIPLLVSPLLTRLYTPEEFGILASFLAITAILAIIVCGRIDHAVLLEKNETAALRVLTLSLILSVIVSCVLAIIFIFGRQEISHLLNNEKLSDWLLFVPISVFFIGVSQALVNWYNRAGRFKLIAISRIGQTSITATINLSLGILATLHGGALIIGAVFGQIIAMIILILPFIKQWSFMKVAFDNRNFIYLQKYKNFPLFTLPADLLNSITVYLPVFILGIMFGAEVVGLYMLTQRVVVMPVSMLGSAISEAYKKEFVSRRNNPEQCFALYKKTLLWSVVAGFPGLVLFYFIAPSLFLLVFGEGWDDAGRMSQILAVLYFFKFVASPLSYVFYVAGKQKEDFILHLMMIIMSAAGLIVPFYMFHDMYYALFGYTFANSIIYIYYIVRAGFLSSQNTVKGTINEKNT